MKITKPSRELKEWELKGWTREPRNGYEWKRLKAGKPQPKNKDRLWSRPYKCKNCGPKVPFKVQSNGDHDSRYCIKCRKATRNKYYSKNKDKSKRFKAIWTDQMNNLQPFLEEGMFTVPSSWLRGRVYKVIDLLDKGDIVVEYLGDPIFVIVNLAKYRKLK